MNKPVSLSKCQNAIALAWFVGLLINGWLFCLDVIHHVFDGQEQAAWSWFLPTLVPTFSLILGTVIRDAGKPDSSATVTPIAVGLTVGLSVAYLLFLMSFILSISGSSTLVEKRLGEMHTFSPFVTAFQGLVGLALGAFFVSQEAKKSTQDAPATAAHDPES